jgi:hypothetical protein
MPDREWKVGQRADWELRRMREDLERCLGALPHDASRAVRLRAQLDEVVAEQQWREPRRRSGRAGLVQ